MMELGVVGSQGFVGRALVKVFSNRLCKVYGYDIKKPTTIGVSGIIAFPEIKTTDPYKTLADLKIPIFVCLPTPMNPDGSCDLSMVVEAIHKLADNGCQTIIIKSTVPPGTTAAIQKSCSANIVFNPEFLSEATAEIDFNNQKRIILGGEELSAAVKLYNQTFPEALIYQISSSSAEMVKYISNCFFAVNISFANEIKQICDAMSIDYEEAIGVATTDPRLNTEHWKVPGPSPAADGSGRLAGFGGSCFPKDLQAMINLCHNIGVLPTVMEATWEKNLEVRPNKDWERLVGRCIR